MSFDEEGNLHEEPPWTDCNGNFDECSGYRDIDGHGTYCAGLVFQIAPEADVFIAKVTPPNTREADPDVVACAIHYATRAWKADIISMSLGFDCPDVALEVALNEHPKTVVFAAAANHGTNGRSITFPASIPSVICVKSANGDGTTSSFCPNTHLPNQISALGEEVLSMWPVDETRGTMQRRCRGTSVSTPIAAAIAALVLDFVYTGCLSNKVMVPNMQNVVDDVKRFPRDRLLRLLQSDLFSNPDQSGAVRNVVPWLLLRDDLRVREGVHTQAARKIRDLLNPHGY
ncbi:subtilisin-like protein [Trichodelitschia bisporula]|uniref:Subtilisin-like protein n=1 Tax=Trichodelitschia bisporula TaxID=703511 RepID=A0A6G1I5D0_9PEZI|nr:subtilisin-like protein [Trichodelitschia bisporula]